MTNGSDIAACFAALINVLEKHGIPRDAIVESFQERYLTMHMQYPEDAAERFVLLHGIATLAEREGRDE